MGRRLLTTATYYLTLLLPTQAGSATLAGLRQTGHRSAPESPVGLARRRRLAPAAAGQRRDGRGWGRRDAARLLLQLYSRRVVPALLGQLGRTLRDGG